MSEEAVIAQKSPYQIEVVEGETYHWCACGRSKNQPFCDGSHQGTSFLPVAYIADKTGNAYRCGCKRTNNQPHCDGSHQSL
jgi:CDGSH-type Zn-finger protein